MKAETLKRRNVKKTLCEKAFLLSSVFCVLAEKKTVSDKKLLRRFSLSQRDRWSASPVGGFNVNVVKKSENNKTRVLANFGTFP